MVGVREDIKQKFIYPKPKYKNQHKTVFEIIGDLLLEYSGDILNHIETTHKVKINGYLSNRHIYPNKPSPTIIWRGGGTGRPVMLLYPSQIRRMTVRECARLPIFLYNFIFYGSVSSQYRQIANTVPVEIGRLFGLQLQKMYI